MPGILHYNEGALNCFTAIFLHCLLAGQYEPFGFVLHDYDVCVYVPGSLSYVPGR